MDRRTDGRTAEVSSLDRACIACSTVKCYTVLCFFTHGVAYGTLIFLSKPMTNSHHCTANTCRK